MSKIYSLNELSVLSFLLSALLGKQPYVLDVAPIIPKFKALLSRLVKTMIERKRARDISELVPEHIPELDYDQRVHFYNVFAALEPWQAEYYDFKRAHDKMPQYARVFRHVTSLHLSQRLVTLFILPSILKKIGNNAKILGLPSDVAEAACLLSKPTNCSPIAPSHIPDKIINALLVLVMIGASTLWGLRRISFSAQTPKPIFFAVDYISDISEDDLINEIQDGGEILLVARTPRDLENIKKAEMPFHACLPKDGVLGPLEAIQLLGRTYKEMAMLFFYFGHLSVTLFYRLIAMPLRRTEYKALFNRYRPKVFWGRDTYDPRHIIRRQELHRINGKSWGVSHSYLTFGTSYPEFRHISFDRYYLLGRGFYDLYCRETWNSDIQIVTAGSFRASRETFKLRHLDKPDDILVLCAAFIVEPGLVELVRTLAENFPERTIHLQVKANFIDTAPGRQFIEACTKGLSNIVLAKGGVYDLLGKARYVFSDPSSIVIEAPQFGNVTMATDVSPTRKPDILLEMPEFCVTSGKHAVRRIRALEAGQWTYPVHDLTKFIDLSGQAFCDRVRQDLGLPEREQPCPAWPELAEKTQANMA